MRSLPWLATATVVLAFGCGPTQTGTGDDLPDDTDAAAGDPDAATGGPDAGFDDTDASCGAQSENIAVENLGDPPDLLIVMDRSGSMSGPIPSFPPNFTPKWTIMRDALNSVVAQREHNIRFGLTEFPTNDDCAVDQAAAVRVPIDLGQAPEVAQYFNVRSPNGNTPAAAGLQAALTHYNSIPVNPAGRYVLFATDGEPNCAVDDATAAADTVAAVTALAQAGIKTYVLGFGGAFTTGTVLNDAALAGQVPRPGGPPHYYAANNAAELSAALQAISGGIIVPSCSYALATQPPVPDDVTVTLNGVPVPRSTMHTNGWDYFPDAMTITFFGTYCQQITSGAVGNVAFAYGCPGPVVD
ncbi:MAG: VWA domain-containing protein [Myxococcales bacterium]|nr:VWA domain-containing protein [Myxococcales bacterium]